MRGGAWFPACHCADWTPVWNGHNSLKTPQNCPLAPAKIAKRT